MVRKKASIFKRFSAFIIDLFAIIGLLFVFEFALINPIFKANTNNIEIVNQYNLINDQYLEIQDEYNIYIYDSNNNRVYNNEVTSETLEKFESDSRVISLKEKIKPYGDKLVFFSILEYSISLFLSSLIILLIFPLIVKDGRTLGKLMLRLTVNNDDNSRIKWYQLVIRFFVQFIFEIYLGIFTFLLTSIISLIVAMTNSKNRSISDLIARTVVFFDIPEIDNRKIKQEQVRKMYTDLKDAIRGEN